MRLYIAAPLAFREFAETTARELHCRGYAIASCWHTTEDNADPTGDVERHAILTRCIGDIDQSDAMVALTHVGNPRATFGEVAYALAMRKRVVWVHRLEGNGRNIWDSHENVRRVVAPLEPWLVDAIAEELAAMKGSRAR